jgi:hypothetical protein
MAKCGMSVLSCNLAYPGAKCGRFAKLHSEFFNGSFVYIRLPFRVYSLLSFCLFAALHALAS